MDYKKVLRLHFVNRLSIREIAENCGDCGKTLHFTELSGRHSVLERPLSEVNGRLFFS